MLVILEGPDGAGKSTLAEQLAAWLGPAGTALLHAGPIQHDAITEYEVPLQDYRPGTGHIICDRWHVGELIYGPLLRGESRMSEAERRHVDLFLAARGALVVHVDAPTSTLVRRLGERGDDLIRTDQLDQIRRAYRATFADATWNCPILRTNYADAILEWGRRAEEACAPLTAFPTYVGGPNPERLLLGERRNLRAGSDLGAFTPRTGSAGRYLLEALPARVFARVGIANALEEDVPALWETLDRPLVVALGRAAQRECERVGIPHGTVAHPQYARRFHHSRLGQYGRLIGSALPGDDRVNDLEDA